MKGLKGLRLYFRGRDPVVEPPPQGVYRFRRAGPGDVARVHNLAAKIYGRGYRFSEKRLGEWWDKNPSCFFLMLCNQRVVGYIDAFPISEGHYRSLLTAEDPGPIEPLIEPLGKDSVTQEASFYIASMLVSPAHRGHVLRFVQKAVLFYEKAYPQKPWKRVCALADTRNGERWLNRMDLRSAKDCKNGRMWYADREVLPHLREENRAFWRRLLP